MPKCLWILINMQFVLIGFSQTLLALIIPILFVKIKERTIIMKTKSKEVVICWYEEHVSCRSRHLKVASPS